jgi:ribonuclease BN (tRNA processing enzyme)
LQNESTALIIDAGVNHKAVLECLDYNTEKVSAVLISHLHGDHKKYAAKLSTYGVKIVTDFKHGASQTFDEWSVLPLTMFHDVETYGFYINHPEMGNLFYATDTGKLPYKLAEPEHILLETNYCEDILQENIIDGKLEDFLANRIRENHLSITQAINWIKLQDRKFLKNVILTHLSSSNSNKKDFKQRMEAAIGIPVYIAQPGLNLDL